LGDVEIEKAIEFKNEYVWWLNEMKKYMHIFGKINI